MRFKFNAIARAFVLSVLALCAVSSVSLPAYAAESEAVEFVAEVNINTANAQEMAEALNGIGMKKAEAIVAYRSTVGKFTSIEQLLDVKGIGEATLNKNRSRIIL